ncbi:N-formyl peptide receptor 2-like [Gastrophryne carolinensis]
MVAPGDNLTVATSGRMENTTANISDSREDYHEVLHRAMHIVGVYLAVVFSVAFLLGTVGNALVIWFVAFKMKKTVNSVWFLSLSVASLIFLLFQPLEVTYLVLSHHWPFGEFMCKLVSYVVPLNMYSSILHLTIISIDRCVCVVFPVWCRNHRTTRLAWKVTLGVWLLAAGCSVPFFIHRTIYTSDGQIYCEEQWVPYYSTGIILMEFTVFFVVPLVIIVSCYMVIIGRMRKNRIVTSSKTFRMIAAVIVSFFICWLPYHVFSLMWVFLPDNYYLSEVADIGFHTSFSLAYTNSCLNPFLYVFFGRHFKEKFWSSIQSALKRAFNEDTDLAESERSTAQRRASASHDDVTICPQSTDCSLDID